MKPGICYKYLGEIHINVWCYLYVSMSLARDLLVLKIVEWGSVSDEEISKIKEVCRVYVFYDYKKCLFGVRCGYRKKKGGTGTFSYCSDKREVLLDFLLEFVSNVDCVEVSLVNFPEVGEDFDDISFAFLEKNDRDKNEVSGYCKNEYVDADAEDDESQMFPNKQIARLLSIVENVYNPISTSRSNCDAHSPQSTGDDHCPVFLWWPYFCSPSTRL